LRGRNNVVTLLLARGALVNAQALSGKTPLHLAATAGHKEMVAFLLAHGADPKIKNTDGQTPLQEMLESSLASSLDPTTKAKIAAMLGPKPALAKPRQPAVAAAPSPSSLAPLAPSPPASSQAPAPSSIAACTDVAGLARAIVQANPNEKNPRVIALAVEQLQIAMGCRQAPLRQAPLWQAPLKTECSQLLDTWTCTTK
jgi:hypothetical protein